MQFTTDEVKGAKVHEFNKFDIDMIESLRLSNHIMNFSSGVYFLENLVFKSSFENGFAIGELPSSLKVDYALPSGDSIATYWSINKLGDVFLDRIEDHMFDELLRWGIENNSLAWEPIPSQVSFTDLRLEIDTNNKLQHLVRINNLEMKRFKPNELAIPFIHCSLYDDIHALPFIGISDNQAWFYKSFMSEVHDCPDFCEHSVILVKDNKLTVMPDNEDPVTVKLPVEGSFIEINGESIIFPQQIIQYSY